MFHQNRRGVNQAETALIARRENEAMRAQRCQAADNFYKRQNFLCSQYKNIEDNKYTSVPKVNIESRILEQKKFEKREKLLKRREKLAALLERETKFFEQEAKALQEVEECSEFIELDDAEQGSQESSKKSNFIPSLQSSSDVVPISRSRIGGKQLAEAKKFTKKVSPEKLQKLILHLKESETELKRIYDRTQSFKIKIRNFKQQYSGNNAHHMEIHENFKMLENLETKMKTCTEKHTEDRSVRKSQISRVLGYYGYSDKLKMMTVEIIRLLEQDLSVINALKEVGECLDLKIDELNLAEQSIMTKIAEEKTWLGSIHMLFNEEAKQIWALKLKEFDQIIQVQDKLMPEAFCSIMSPLKEARDEEVFNQEKLFRDFRQLPQKVKKLHLLICAETKKYRQIEKRCTGALRNR